MSPELRYYRIREVILDVIGHNERNEYALDNSRETEFMQWRALAAFQMAKDGFSFSSIGRCMKRNHSTVRHHVNKIHDILEMQFSGDRDIIDKYSFLEKELDSTENRIMVVHMGQICGILNECGLQQDQIDCIVERMKQL